MSQTCKIWKSLTFNRQAVHYVINGPRKAQSPQRQSRVYSTKRKSNLTLKSGERA
jgi:hypothetical protein